MGNVWHHIIFCWFESCAWATEKGFVACDIEERSSIDVALQDEDPAVVVRSLLRHYAGPMNGRGGPDGKKKENKV